MKDKTKELEETLKELDEAVAEVPDDTDQDSEKVKEKV